MFLSSSYSICQLLMAMLTRTTILISLFLADAYETWHLVDLAQVVCPKPTSSNPDAPVFPDYNLGINYSSELQVDAPHIIGFIRASKQAMSITFKVEDFYGEQVGGVQMMANKWQIHWVDLGCDGLCLSHICENPTPTSQGTEGAECCILQEEQPALQCHTVFACCILPFLRWFQRLQLNWRHSAMQFHPTANVLIPPSQ